MSADRLGSYSTDATRAETPSLSLRKSMVRYRRLCPPPRHRVVVTPWKFRPPFFLIAFVRRFSGFPVVISEKSYPRASRRPGDVGLCFFIPILPVLTRIR